MIKTLAASKAAKLLATCVCPVAGTVALTVAVPQVRSAVHKATAPRAYALPKTRVRAPAGLPQTAALAAPCAEPLGIAASDFGPIKAFSDLPPVSLTGPNDVPGGGTQPEGPIVKIKDLPDNTGHNPPVSPIPEPKAWVQLLLGFGIIGAVMRTAKRRDDVAAPTEQADA